ncbi:hypothetical protein F66182_17952 [Fusarium sp. NRRL 66182]|nr:hypothetical protein F66182_17952 [Fusarium sp. NRRL 66182]
MDNSKSTKVENVPTFQHGDLASPPTEPPVRIRTIIAVIAVNFAVFGQTISLVGSGFLAQTMAGLLGDTSKAVWFIKRQTFGDGNGSWLYRTRLQFQAASSSREQAT